MTDQEVIDGLRKIVGEARVLTDSVSRDAWGGDWTKVENRDPLAVVLPGSPAEVSEIVRFCSAAGRAIVPSGGRTGLAGGAVAANREIVVSLDRLNKIEKIDRIGLTIKLQAGVTMEAAQAAAKQEGLLFALDLGARGSCQIGGNIATNAGGTKFIRYGGAREQVLGIEVILPSGEILDLNNAVRKNNTGYDLRQLFIGSEGTLGIITSATMKLLPRPGKLELACMAVNSFADIPKILQFCHKQDGIVINAFEFFTRAAHEIVIQQSDHLKSPFQQSSEFYVLLETECSSLAASSPMEAILEGLLGEGLIQDAVIATNSREFEELWAHRERITESLASGYRVHKNDVSVAINQLEPFVGDLERIIERHGSDSGIKLILFGHIGDGNLHLNYIGPKEMDVGEFRSRTKVVEKAVFECIKDLRGSISAEHGIGKLKKADLHYSRTELELEIMRNIKRALDPRGIMNPGKIF